MMPELKRRLTRLTDSALSGRTAMRDMRRFYFKELGGRPNSACSLHHPGYSQDQA
jgi:hypothetical protein